MTKQKFFKSLFIISISFSISAQAAGTCLADKSDIKSDMEKIADKLNIKYAPGATFLSINKIYDNQQLKVDRTDPFLKQVNAVGVIKPFPNSNNHATAILISPCHVLVNSHAISNSQAKKSATLVYISLGQNSCDSPSEFAYSNISGKVISMGDRSETEQAINPANDYAIVKISQPIYDVLLPFIDEDSINANDTLMSVGFPKNATRDSSTGLRYPTANFVKPTYFNVDGTFRSSTNVTEEGSSGSGLFILDKNSNESRQLVLAGIHVALDDYGAIGIQTFSILRNLKSNNPIVYDQIKSAIVNNRCN